MLNLTQNLSNQLQAADHKIHGASKPLPYLIAAMLAGAFIGLADVFMMTAAGPLQVAGSAWTSLIQGAVFGLGLILVVFAGGELATSAMMILPIGVIKKQVLTSKALFTFILMLIGNFLGSTIIAALVWGTQIMAPTTPVGKMLDFIVSGKAHKTNPELFFRGILCNILVCLAIWSVGRMENEVAKMVIMAWGMAAFVTSGFEHVVANMTTFMLGIFYQIPAASLGEMLRNLSLVLLGNIVGGAVFVGGSYLLAVKTEE